MQLQWSMYSPLRASLSLSTELELKSSIRHTRYPIHHSPSRWMFVITMLVACHHANQSHCSTYYVQDTLHACGGMHTIQTVSTCRLRMDRCKRKIRNDVVRWSSITRSGLYNFLTKKYNIKIRHNYNCIKSWKYMEESFNSNCIPRSCLQLIRYYHDKYLTLLRYPKIKRNKNYNLKLIIFKNEAKSKLFDIAACTACLVFSLGGWSKDAY